MRLLTMLVLAASSSCATIDELRRTVADESKQWRDQTDKLAKVVKDTADSVALAIPGERYNRLLIDSRSDDPKVREQAQQLIVGLFNLPKDDANAWQGTIWFESNKKLRMDAFRAPTVAQEHLQQYYSTASLNLEPVTSNTPTVASPRIAVENKVRDALNAVYTPIPWTHDTTAALPRGTLTPMVGCVSTNLNPCTGVVAEFSIDGRSVFANASELSSLASAQREVAIQNITSAIIDASLVTMNHKGGALVVPWIPFDDRQVLLVVVDSEDWTSNLRITAALTHKQTGELFPGTRPYVFSAEEFAEVTLQDPTNHRPPRKVRWAVHSLTEGALLSDKIRAVRAALRDYESLYPTVEGGKPLTK